jgi:hypothetical protein
MAVASTTYRVGLTIPAEAERQIQEFAREWTQGAPIIKIPAVGQFRVHLLTVTSQSVDDLEKIRRAVADLSFQRDSFGVSTTRASLGGHRTVAVLCVRSCGVPLRGSSQGSGYLRALCSKIQESLVQQGIAQEAFVPPMHMCDPYVVFAATNDQRIIFGDEMQGEVPIVSRVGWQTSSQDVVVE